MVDEPRRGPGAYVLIGFALGFSLAGFMATHNTFSKFPNWIGPEIIGIVITVGGIGWLNKRRAQRQLKDQLMRQIRSSVRDVAVAALDELADLGLLAPDKETLVGADLDDVQWTGARLWETNLQQANLEYANLKEASLDDANLQQTSLYSANLQQANLGGANLQQASLDRANLQNASLLFTNLQGVDLQWANLRDTIFGENTTLPDGTQWTPDTDMTRFTDPDHPDFWRPEPSSVWWYPEDEQNT